MKQQLRKPENWQDFETLCKMLWGEIWDCAEIKKNGRSGQNQQGIDVYGIPKSESRYYGIQCKGKDDYTNAQLTEKEVDNEIEKALQFKPELLKMYFATTANKDAKIEEYIRIKNLDNKANVLFEVHLFSWEDIVELIDINKRTHDWYVRSIKFATRHKIELTFFNGEKNLELHPIFIKSIINYTEKALLNEVLKTPDFLNSPFLRNPLLPSIDKDEIENLMLHGIKEEEEDKKNSPQPKTYSTNVGIGCFYTTYNRSVCVIKLCLKNQGTEVIEDYKIYFKINGVIKAETVYKKQSFLDFTKYHYDLLFYKDSPFEGVIEPQVEYLVQQDSICFDELCFKPYQETADVNIEWELVSRDFYESGTLSIKVIPEIELQEETLFIDNPSIRDPETIIRNKYDTEEI